MFYLLFPLLCRFPRGRWIFIALLAFVLLGPFGRTVLTHGNETWQEYSYLGGTDAIAMGCMTALLLHGRVISRTTLQFCVAAGLALLVFCLCFSRTVDRLGLEDAGLGMTLVGLGACLLIAAAAQTGWRAPRLLNPVLAYGRRSYEIYLTHMFLVFAGFNWFITRGASLRTVPVLFAATILLAGVLGEVVGRFYSEPANRWLRSRFGESASRMGSELPPRAAGIKA